ncbi:MAG: DNA mismatch repair protein MutS [Bacteroidales bacterium]
MAEKIEKEYAETPLMKQYFEIKTEHPDAILLFRIGDFYETFGKDAIFTAKVLNIVLTRRANGSGSYIELAGFPYHALDTYLHKLVQAGGKVAICEQLEDPKLTKKIVKRGITELITPGVAFNDKLLENGSNNFLAALHLLGKEIGISFLDVSTGQFFVSQGSDVYIKKLLQNFKPSEIIIQRNQNQEFKKLFGENYYLTTLDDWVFKSGFSNELLCKHFATNSLKGFGVDSLNEGLIAAGACLHYLLETKHEHSSHITKISRIDEQGYVWLDGFTMRNLELLNSSSFEGQSLVRILDKTQTPMGARLLKRWVALPLYDLEKIQARLDLVEFFVNESQLNRVITTILAQIGDLERLVSKIAVLRASPREVEKLKLILLQIKELKNLAPDVKNKAFTDLIGRLDACESLFAIIEKSLKEEPAISVQKGQVIATGFNAELDDLRALSFSGKDYLVKIQQEEIARTGISSLKLGFNNVFGYYLEVTHAHKDKVPDTWIRKQTLTSGERYITEEIKSYEQKVLSAEEKILSLENQLYMELLQSVLLYMEPLQINAQSLAKLDVIVSFSNVSIENNYVKPVLNMSSTIDIIKGRHPMIEKSLPIGEMYIPNDVYLDTSTQQIMMITGPNMSGKSAVLRQTALIVLMSQMGCFVPAFSATLGLTDKVFTRVGASDNISSGESTFMVEMNETANILHNISDRSLVLLDEIGRGTSTYDGISIAWAIAEYLHAYAPHRAKVLFATHYHELNALAKEFPRIKNFHVNIKEVGTEVIFLRNLLEGGSEHSFGIHVARMAGMPKEVLDRAEEMIEILESSRTGQANLEEAINNLKKKYQAENVKENKEHSKTTDSAGCQLSFIQLEDPLLSEIKEEILTTDIDTLTPVEALVKLHAIKKKLKA